MSSQAGAVGIHADSHPLLTVDKPRVVACLVDAHAHVDVSARVWDRRNSGTEMGKGGGGGGGQSRPGYIRMQAARFANTRRVLLLCQPGIKPVGPSVYIFRALPVGFSLPFSSPFFRFPRNFFTLASRKTIILYRLARRIEGRIPFSKRGLFLVSFRIASLFFFFPRKTYPFQI